MPAPEFTQGDACNLKPSLTGYDLVFAANLIDRLYEPAKFLNDIHTRINQGGLLMIASPCSGLKNTRKVLARRALRKTAKATTFRRPKRALRQTLQTDQRTHASAFRHSRNQPQAPAQPVQCDGMGEVVILAA